MKKKIILALLLVTALTLPLSGCTHKQKKKTKNVEDNSKQELSKTADDIKEREIESPQGYKVALGKYTVTFYADKGFAASKEQQLPKESLELGARAVKYTNKNGEELFLSYTPKEMTPNVGIATDAKGYMKLTDDGTISKWAEDVKAGSWKGYHYKAVTKGNNMVGYDLYYDSQEIKIAVSSANEEEYPSISKLNIVNQ